MAARFFFAFAGVGLKGNQKGLMGGCSIFDINPDQ